MIVFHVQETQYLEDVRNLQLIKEITITERSVYDLFAFNKVVP